MEWQKQSFSGTGMLSSALAGKIQRGKTGTTAFEQKTPVKSAELPAENTGWNPPPMTAADPAQQMQFPQEEYPEDNGADVWHKLMIIGALVAVIFLVLSVVLIAVEQITAAIVFMMIALGAAVLALVGLIQFRRLS